MVLPATLEISTHPSHRRASTHSVRRHQLIAIGAQSYRGMRWNGRRRGAGRWVSKIGAHHIGHYARVEASSHSGLGRSFTPVSLTLSIQYEADTKTKGSVVHLDSLSTTRQRAVETSSRPRPVPRPVRDPTRSAPVRTADLQDLPRWTRRCTQLGYHGHPGPGECAVRDQYCRQTGHELDKLDSLCCHWRHAGRFTRKLIIPRHIIGVSRLNLRSFASPGSIIRERWE